MVWGFFVVIPGVLCQVASLAEMSSVQPIAGAQYHWTWLLAPPKHRRFITWIQGWITWFSWISLLCSVVNVAANITTTLVSISYPDWYAQGWHTLLIMYAYLIVLGAINMYLFWITPWIELLAGVLHVVLWVVFTSVLLALAPRHSTEFVFLEGSNMSVSQCWQVRKQARRSTLALDLAAVTLDQAAGSKVARTADSIIVGLDQQLCLVESWCHTDHLGCRW